MVLSISSPVPVFPVSTTSHQLLIYRCNSQLGTRRRRGGGILKNPLRATPASIPATDASQEIPVDDDLIDAQDSEEISSTDKFSWRDHWYPVSLVEDLDPHYPTPFQLLNRDLVLWFDRNAKEWVAFDDRCPHRLAPLSEGRIDENGHLQCSYHGWSFNGCGSCTRVPQAATEGPEARALESPRACATRFPAMVSQGLLFVWPDENGWERALATQPPRLPDDFDNPEFSPVTVQRDLYYGYDTLSENVLDPSHTNIAHHKVISKRERAKPLPFKMESSGPWGFASVNDSNPKMTAKFLAPCYAMYKIEFDMKLLGDKKPVAWNCFFNVPMAPGKTRSIACSARNFYRFTLPGRVWWQVIPRWHEHWTGNRVYDGDMVVLQGQEKALHALSKDTSSDTNKLYTKITFTPTQADCLVLGFRNWLRQHGNNQPQWFGTPIQPPVFPKRKMLDRYEQHTVICSSCRNGYNTFQTLQKLLIAAAIICTATTGIPNKLQLRIALGAAAVVSAALAYVVNRLQNNFVYLDYIHADME